MRKRRRGWWLWLGVSVCVDAPGVAQAVAWRVPDGGAAEYRRSWRARASAACRSRALAQRAALEAELPAKFLPRRPPAPVLCAGELQADLRALLAPVGDLRDVLRAVAFDLSGRSAQAAYPRLLPFGDLRVKGSWSKREPGGAQQLAAKLRARAPSRRRDEPRGRHARLQARCVEAVEGDLVVNRSVDVGRGLVTGFHVHARFTEGKQERDGTRHTVEFGNYQRCPFPLRVFDGLCQLRAFWEPGSPAYHLGVFADEVPQVNPGNYARLLSLQA